MCYIKNPLGTEKHVSDKGDNVPNPFIIWNVILLISLKLFEMGDRQSIRFSAISQFHVEL